MAPAEVLTRFVEPQGARGRPLGEIVFRGCPQDDPRALEILEAFASATLAPEALAEIGFTWRNTPAQCDYAPLGDWYDSALRQLVASGDMYNLQFFVHAMGQHATETMRETIWTTLEARTEWTQEMVREHPTIFMRTLVRAVPTFPDDRLLLVLRVLQRNIRGGGLGRQAPALNALRWVVGGRAGISGDSLIGQ